MELSSLFIVEAKTLAVVVLPTPLGPEKRNACASLFIEIALFSVCVIWLWPTIWSKDLGLHLSDSI